MRQGLDHREPRGMLIRLRTLGNYVRVLHLCSFAKLCPTLVQICGLQPARLQEYWSGLPFPSPGYLANPGIKPLSSTLTAGFFTIEPPVKPYVRVLKHG